MNRRQMIAVALGASVALAALVAGSLWRETSSPGHARRAHFLGDKVVIVDQERTTRSHAIRVRVHDLHTGKELVRERLPDGLSARRPEARSGHYDCIPASPTRGLSPGPMVDLDDGSLLVTAKDGRLYRIGLDLTAQLEPPRMFDRSDPAALEKWATDSLHPEDLRLPAHAVTFDRGSGLTERAELSGHTLRLEESDAAGKRRVISLRVPRAEEAPPGPPAVSVPHPQQTFLDAGFLSDPDWGGRRPVVLDGPALVLAHAELDKAGRQLVLSRVDGEGGLGWSRELGDEQVLGARLSEGVLAIVLRDSLVGLDPAAGAVRYRNEL